jgi:hypothetical protein
MGAVTPVSDSPSARLLRFVFVLDAVVFFGAALFNFGLKIPLGFTTLRFADAIWQAGTGETVIGAVLLWAGLTRGRRLSWVAWVLSVLGIAFGLSSERVQGAARDLHVLMIILAVLVLVLLLVTRRRDRHSVDRATSAGQSR